MDAYLSHRNACTEFAAPFCCSCGFTCGTASALERHCAKGGRPHGPLCAPAPEPPQSQTRRERAAEIRLLLLGLDRAGKTTIMEHLFQERPSGEYRPTVGVNMKSRSTAAPPLNLTVTEVGGQARAHWAQFLAGLDALIYVVDVGDERLVDQSCYELFRLLEDGRTADVPLLLLANAAAPGSELRGQGLSRVGGLVGGALGGGSRVWQVHGCCARTGEGLGLGVRWLEGALASCGKLCPGEALFDLA